MNKKPNIKKYPFTLKKGAQFIPVENTCGHNYIIGQTYTAGRAITFTSPESTFTLGGVRNNIKACEIHVLELSSVAALKSRLAYNTEEIERLLTEKSFLEESIEMLKELDPTGKKEFDEKLLRLSYAIRKVEQSGDVSSLTSKAMLMQSILDY